MTAPLLEGGELTKRYGGVTVVDRVSITANAGQIHAVVGENGAGKSTLMNMLTGVVSPDEGEIRLLGHPAHLVSPRRAAEQGIAIVHRELHLVPLRSITENLMLVRPASARGLRRHSRAEDAYVRAAIRRVGLDLDPATPVRELSVAECRLLEIAKALALEAKVIIFDEPTAALLPQERRPPPDAGRSVARRGPGGALHLACAR